MGNFIKGLKNYIPHVILILILLVVQAWCNIQLPSYTSDILDVGIEQNGIKNAAAVELSDDTMAQLQLFMNDEDRSLMDQSYTLEDEIWYLEDDADTSAVSDALELPMAMVYNLSSISEENFRTMIAAQLSMDEDVLNGLSLEDIGNMIGVDLDVTEAEDGTVTVNIMPVLVALEQSGALDDAAMLEMVTDLSEQYGDSSDLILSSLAVSFVQTEYTNIGVNVNQIRTHYLYGIAVKMIIVTVIMALASIAAGFFASFVAAKNSQTLRHRVFKKVLSFSNTEIDKFSTASLITRCTNDIQQIQMTMVMLLRMVLYAPILAIMGIVKVVQVRTGLTWIVVVAAIVMTIVILGLLFMAMPKFKIMQYVIDKVNLISREILEGIPVIRAFGRERHEEKRFDVANVDLMKVQLFTNRVMTFMMPLMMLIMNGVNLLIIWFGAKGMDNGFLQVGDMVAFMTYAMEIIMSFMMIEMISIMLPRAGVAANRVEEVCRTEPVIHDIDKPEDQESYQGRVEFDHVTFRYPGAEEPALADITFTAEPGQTTAIIGSTGCGKSTLINLIPRFYDVTEGQIRLDGTDIRNITQKTLRAQLGLVPQKGFLFSGTIESNIKYSGANVTDEFMVEAAEIAQATEFIESKPDQYNSPIAKGGNNVSGGQKQRLSIARALAKHAPVLIFDDSFSALDYKTDVALRRALNEKLGGSTVIIVAQRISTILHADKIIVLDEGRIQGIGTHEELLRSCKTYQEIARSQLSEAELAATGGVV